MAHERYHTTNYRYVRSFPRNRRHLSIGMLAISHFTGINTFVYLKFEIHEKRSSGAHENIQKKNDVLKHTGNNCFSKLVSFVSLAKSPLKSD